MRDDVKAYYLEKVSGDIFVTILFDVILRASKSLEIPISIPPICRSV